MRAKRVEIVSGLRQGGAIVLVLGALLGLTGCSRRTVARGVVTLDGTPVTEGMVSFAPADGKGPTAGAKITNGVYELNGKVGLTSGEKIVSLRVALKTGRQIEAGMPFPRGTKIDEMIYFPPPTAKDDYTETREIVAGQENVFDFALKLSADDRAGRRRGIVE